LNFKGGANMKNKPFVIYDQQLAGFLMENNCRLMQMRPDRKCPTKNVFIFDNDDNRIPLLIEFYKNMKENED
jgi:hypothetical protein